MQAALEGLQDAASFDASVDAVVELIYATSAKGSPSTELMPLVQMLVSAVSSSAVWMWPRGMQASLRPLCDPEVLHIPLAIQPATSWPLLMTEV